MAKYPPRIDELWQNTRPNYGKIPVRTMAKYPSELWQLDISAIIQYLPALSQANNTTFEQENSMAAGKNKAPMVRKSNAIARARWSPDSIWEPRLIAILASKINSNDAYLQTYDIPVVEIIGKNHGGKDYLQFEKALEKAVDKVMSRVITIRNDSGWKKYPLFSTCEYNRNKCKLIIGIHNELREHFLQLKQYVKYNLTEFMLLPSIYSQRMFELLKSWSDKNEITLEISELHEILESPDSAKSNFAEFKRRVLDKANKDINEQTELRYSWEPIKTGRAVTAIKFIFNKEQKQRRSKLSVGTAPHVPVQNETAVAFEKFFQMFPNPGGIETRLRAKKMWDSLRQSGNAPLAADVPADNELSVIEFLEKWQETNA